MYGADTVKILIAARDATAAAFATVNARMKTLEATATRVRKAVARIAKATLLIGAAGVTASIYASTRAFMSFEDALADVRKTTSMTKDEILSLGSALTALSTTKLPMARTELAAIAAVAGQLGIQGKEDILSFTESVAMMSVAFDMSAEDAATAMAKLGKIYNIPIEQTMNLASAINILGNTTAAKEREIIAFSMALGPVAAQLGFTETQTLSLGATLVSMGMDASHAGTRLNRAFSMIGQNINELADFMGVSAEQFTRSFDEMPMETFIDILKKLDEVGEGLAANTVASELFGEVGSKTIKTLLGSLDELYTNLKNSDKAFHENTAVAEEFANKTDTLTAKWQLFKNEVIAAFGKLGTLMAPTLNALIATFKNAVPVLLNYIMNLKNELAPAIENVKEIFKSLKGILKDLFGTDAEEELSVVAKALNTASEYAKRFFDMLDRNPALVKFALAIGAATVALSYAVPAVLGLYTALTFLSLHPALVGLAALSLTLVYLEAQFGIVSNAAAQFGRGLIELKNRLEPVITGLNELRDRLPELTARFGFVTDVINSAVIELKKLYDLLPDVAKRALGLARNLVELKTSFLFGGPLGALAKGIYDLGDNIEDTGDQSEEAAAQIELTKEQLQTFITEIEASTPKIQEYKDAVEATAIALKTWETAQLDVQKAQLALSQPKADLTELNRLLAENVGLEQELAAIVAESQVIWVEAGATHEAALEAKLEIETKLTGLVKARAQAEEDAAAKIARIAQNEINAKNAIQRANLSLLQSQRALITALEDYDDLTRSLAGAELSVEGAEIAVEKAQRAYDQIKGGWSKIEIGFSFPGMDSMDPFAEQDALLALERAELDLANAIDTRADTQERVNALKGAEELKNVIAAYKGLSVEEFETTFYVGGQLDIESLKESITDEDAAIISERIKKLLPDVDLGAGIENIIKTITGYEDDILTLEQKLTGYTQDRLDVSEDLHEELESLYKDEIKWNEDLRNAKEDLDTAIGNLKVAEREWGKISKLYADIVKVADNDRLIRAGVLYDTINKNETDYNTLLETTGKTYNDLETDVKNLQTVIDAAITAEKKAQVEHNTELGKTKTLLENDMVAAWNTLTQHLETTPANATIALPDIEALLKPFFADIQKLADDNPIKIAFETPKDGGGGGGEWALDYKSLTAKQASYYHGKGDMNVPGAVSSSDWSLEKYRADMEALGVPVEKYEWGWGPSDVTPVIPTPIADPYKKIDDYAAAHKKESWWTTAWKNAVDKGYSFTPGEAPPIDSEKPVPAPTPSPEPEAPAPTPSPARACEEGETKCVGTEYWKCVNGKWKNKGEWAGKCGYKGGGRTLAHSGGETLKKGLIEVESGEWIFPRDVVAKLRDLITTPITATTQQSTINIVMNNTINNKADADYLITKFERVINKRALT